MPKGAMSIVARQGLSDRWRGGREPKGSTRRKIDATMCKTSETVWNDTYEEHAVRRGGVGRELSSSVLTKTSPTATPDREEQHI